MRQTLILLSSWATNKRTIMANSLRRVASAQQHDLKDAHPTERHSHDLWNFGTSSITPSIMDPNSQNFNMFANQMPGYYTPTPGGTNTIYQQTNAGDLHTPGFTMGMETPLSLPTSAGALHAGQQFTGFPSFAQPIPQQMEQHQPFQNPDPFGLHQQQAFPPHHFTHQPTFEHLEGPIGESPIDSMGLDMPVQEQHHSPQMLFHPQALRHPAMQHAPLRGNEEK